MEWAEASSEDSELAALVGGRIYFQVGVDGLLGRVVGIASQANTVGGDVVYAVTIALDDQLPGLRWEMSLGVEIDVEPQSASPSTSLAARALADCSAPRACTRPSRAVSTCGEPRREKPT
jgi:hypothetical protein